MKVSINNREIVYHRHKLNTEHAYYEVRTVDNPESKTSGIQEAIYLADYANVSVTVNNAMPTGKKSISLGQGIYTFTEGVKKPKAIKSDVL